MYEKMARSIIGNAKSNKFSLERIAVGIEVLLNNLTTITIFSLVAYIYESFAEAVIIMLNFILIRSITGGRHFNTSLKCTIASITILLSILFVSTYFNLSDGVIFYLNLLSAISFLVFAPYGMEKSIKVSFNYLRLYKILSVLIVLLNLVILKSELLCLTYFAQSLSVIHWNKRR